MYLLLKYIQNVLTVTLWSLANINNSADGAQQVFIQRIAMLLFSICVCKRILLDEDHQQWFLWRRNVSTAYIAAYKIT